MAFPTTQWGPANLVYSTLPSASSPPQTGDGPQLGTRQLLADGTTVQFVQTINTLAQYKAVTLTSSTTWPTDYQITPTTGINQPVVGVNDQSGQSVTANYYCWITVTGLMFPLVANSTSQGVPVASSSTNGTLYGATAGTDIEGDLVSAAANSSGAAASTAVLRVG